MTPNFTSKLALPPRSFSRWSYYRFSPKCLADFASIVRDNLTMRTLAVIFVLALITIAFEIYSDAALTSAEVSVSAAAT
jgi:hypothetical protein